MDFADVFRSHLERSGVSHAKFGELVGVTAAFVSQVATRRSKPPLDRVEEWAIALKIPLRERAEFTRHAQLAHCPEPIRADYLRLREQLDRLEKRVAEFEARYDP